MMKVRLFHFSDDPTIEVFDPRPIRVNVERPRGQEWLNGSLVWATDEAHELLYLFPRECPRILVWPTPVSTPEDKTAWFNTRSYAAIAYIESAWFERLRTGVIHRYELPPRSFEDIGEVGMWVSQTSVKPVDLLTMRDLLKELESHGVELRVMERLTPLKGIWSSSLHASGIRLRNAQDWGKPGWTHSKPGRSVLIERK